MMRTNRFAAVVILTSIIVMSVPGVFFAQGQIQTSQAYQLVNLADQAEKQVKKLIDAVYANETAVEAITDADLLDDLKANVSFYDQGVQVLLNSHVALEAGDYEASMTNAIEALQIFRETFRSIHILLRDAGLQFGQLVDSQAILEAMIRAIERIEQLRAILPSDATEALALLDHAESYLDLEEAKQLLLNGESGQVISDLSEARQLLAQVYSYLKELGVESNIRRISDFCQRIQERAQERFRYGQQQGIDTNSIVQALGYENETQFMQTLQNMTQTAQGNANDFGRAMQELEAVSQMYQQMDQTMGQEIMRRQGGNGNGGFGGGVAGSGAGGGGHGFGGG